MEESEKKKVGYYLPAAIADAVEEVVRAQGVGEREKSDVIGAAILMLLEAPGERQGEYISLVRGAGRNAAKIVAEARAKSAAQKPEGKVFRRGKRPDGSNPSASPSGHGANGSHPPERAAK